MNTRLISIGSLVVCWCACEVGPLAADGFNEQEQALLAEMVLPVSPPWDADNEAVNNKAAIELGHALFFDRDIAVSTLSYPDGGTTFADGGSGRVSCADCHMPTHALSDAHSPNGSNVSLSVDFGFTKRNTPTVLNAVYYKVWPWGGRSDRLWLENAFAYRAAQNGSAAQLAQVISAKYPALYAAAFLPGGDLEVNVGKALAAYERLLITHAAPLDRYALGDRDALSPGQKRGLKLFLGKAGCIGCHRGPMLTDSRFRSVGIAQTGPNVPATDDGLFKGLSDRQAMPLAPDKTALPEPWMKGLFRTKSLREIARTGPYFHAGQLQTLDQVVDFYDRGGDHQGVHPADPVIVPLGLTTQEKLDLVAFLGALSGDDPDAKWLSTPVATP